MDYVLKVVSLLLLTGKFHIQWKSVVMQIVRIHFINTKSFSRWSTVNVKETNQTYVCLLNHYKEAIYIALSARNHILV